MKRIDITGQRFGKLVVVKDEPGQGHNPKVLVECDCGRKCYVVKGHLKSGRVTKCSRCRWDRIVGKRFGRRVVMARLVDGRFRVKCDCGAVSVINRVDQSDSCGCLAVERAREAHGRFVTIGGERKTLSGWAEVLGVTRERVRQLHNKGRLVERVQQALKVAKE